MNSAQRLIESFGGKCLLVAGFNGHWWADHATPKKQRQRKGRIGKGVYGRNLMAHYDEINFEKCKARQEKRRAAARL